jgi:hypothetical protein
VEPTSAKDRSIPNYKPDTLIRDNRKEMRVSIDVAVLGEINAIKKENEKY